MYFDLGSSMKNLILMLIGVLMGWSIGYLSWSWDCLPNLSLRKISALSVIRLPYHCDMCTFMHFKKNTGFVSKGISQLFLSSHHLAFFPCWEELCVNVSKHWDEWYWVTFLRLKFFKADSQWPENKPKYLKGKVLKYVNGWLFFWMFSLAI